MRITVIIPAGTSPQDAARVAQIALDQRMETELEIGRKVEARYGEQAIALAREQARNELGKDKLARLKHEVKRLRKKVERGNGQQSQILANLTALVEEIIQHTKLGRLPYAHYLEAAAVLAAERCYPAGPFLTDDPNSSYNLREGNDALTRLNIVAQVLREGHSGNTFFDGKSIPAGDVIAFLAGLADLNSTDETYGAVKVLLAQAKPAVQASSKPVKRSRANGK